MRPITLLNTNYKTLSVANAVRFKTGILTIISETDFVKRSSFHNIRLVLDLLDYSEIIQEGGLFYF